MRFIHRNQDWIVGVMFFLRQIQLVQLTWLWMLSETPVSTYLRFKRVKIYRILVQQNVKRGGLGVLQNLGRNRDCLSLFFLDDGFKWWRSTGTSDYISCGSLKMFRQINFFPSVRLTGCGFDKETLYVALSDIGRSATVYAQLQLLRCHYLAQLCWEASGQRLGTQLSEVVPFRTLIRDVPEMSETFSKK